MVPLIKWFQFTQGPQKQNIACNWKGGPTPKLDAISAIVYCLEREDTSTNHIDHNPKSEVKRWPNKAEQFHIDQYDQSISKL